MYIDLPVAMAQSPGDLGACPYVQSRHLEWQPELEHPLPGSLLSSCFPGPPLVGVDGRLSEDSSLWTAVPSPRSPGRASPSTTGTA